MKKKIPVKKSRTNSSNKRTTVKSRHLDDNYKDPDVVLSFTMFEILTRYMEKESIHVDWNWNTEHRKVFRELDHLTFWFNHIYVPWKNDKYISVPEFKGDFLKRECEEDGKVHYVINREGNEEYWDKIDAITVMEDNMNERLIKNMKRLCELSPYLWS